MISEIPQAILMASRARAYLLILVRSLLPPYLQQGIVVDIGQNASIEVMPQAGSDKDKSKEEEASELSLSDWQNGSPLPISCEIAAPELDRKRCASSEMS